MNVGLSPDVDHTDSQPEDDERRGTEPTVLRVGPADSRVGRRARGSADCGSQRAKPATPQAARTPTCHGSLATLVVRTVTDQKGPAPLIDVGLIQNKAFRCAYVARQLAVKTKYRLWVTQAEKDAIGRVLASCPGQRLPAPGAPIPVTVTRTPPTPTPTPGHTSTSGGGSGTGHVYANCAAARPPASRRSFAALLTTPPTRRCQPVHRQGVSNDDCDVLRSDALNRRD
jgi:hypothetical protein